MRDMPRPRKPYIQREVTRHDKTIWYFRRGKSKRVRLPSPYGSPEFNAAYDRCLTGNPEPEAPKAPKTSLRWLVNRYYESGRFALLRPNTQRNRRLMLEDVCKTGGDRTFAKLTPTDIKKGLTRREKTLQWP